ncbi:MAG: hypothetical protein JJV95_04280 [Sulfurospirillum sp.]|nr:hypothetical protein [Sulfurospirillum sp.]MBL0703180.1 hypothetical protein [Sulfurospirillum sp.]
MKSCLEFWGRYNDTIEKHKTQMSYWTIVTSSNGSGLINLMGATVSESNTLRSNGYPVGCIKD